MPDAKSNHYRVAIALVALLAVGNAAGETYKWVDESGQTHFSDRPPPGVVVEQIQIRPPPSSLSPEQAAERVDQLRMQQAAEAARRGEEDKAEAGAEAEAQVRYARRERCDRARWALAALETQRPVYRDENGAYRVKRGPNEPDVYAGTREYLDDATRAREIARAQAVMTEDCAAFPDAQDKTLAEEELRLAEHCEAAQAELAALRRPEARAPADEIAHRQQFIEQNCWPQ